MEIEKMVKALYEKDTKEAFAALLELEKISEAKDLLYDYVNEFFEMINNKKYVIRVRGYRLLCKQAKWDKKNKINKMIDKILLEIEDEKQTAIRQKIKSLEDIAKNKTELRTKIKHKILGIDCSKYRETMQGLIEKDIKNLLTIINEANK
jgi:prophage DNA circulation protein